MSPIYRTDVLLPSRCCILYFFSTNISTEYFNRVTTGCFIIIAFRLLFTFCDLNYANIYCLISCCLQTSPSQANAMYYHFYVEYLPLVSHKTTQHSTFSPSVIKFRRKIKPLNLHISKHHKHNPLLWLFLCNISTEELTLGTGVSLVTVTFHGTNWWDFDSFVQKIRGGKLGSLWCFKFQYELHKRCY